MLAPWVQALARDEDPALRALAEYFQLFGPDRDPRVAAATHQRLMADPEEARSFLLLLQGLDDVFEQPAYRRAPTPRWRVASSLIDLSARMRETFTRAGFDIERCDIQSARAAGAPSDAPPWRCLWVGRVVRFASPPRPCFRP